MSACLQFIHTTNPVLIVLSDHYHKQHSATTKSNNLSKDVIKCQEDWEEGENAVTGGQ